MKFGIVGGGALGLVFAAALTPHHDVTLLVRRSDVAENLRRDGIAAERDGVVTTTPVHATTAATDLAACDVVLVAVKAGATHDALAPLASVLRAGALVVSLQNGIDHVDVARAVLPGARVVAGPTMQGATLIDTRSVRFAGSGETVIARDGLSDPRADDVVAAFLTAGLRARAVDDATAILWDKLVRNCAINPLAALVGRTNGAVASDPELIGVARQLAAEAAAVALAEGVDVGDPWTLVEAAAKATAANRSSMLQDIEAGRTTEIDAISGAVLRRAERRGIPVPATAMIVALVHAKERA